MAGQRVRRRWDYPTTSILSKPGRPRALRRLRPSRGPGLRGPRADLWDHVDDGYRALDQPLSVGQTPVLCQIRLVKLRARAQVVPSGAEAAPTPEVILPPSVCHPELTPGVVPANSL